MAQLKPNWEAVPPRDWSEEQTRRVADEMRNLRGRRSAQWLANRTEHVGYPVSRTVISDLENGRRRYITTAELCALSSALGVAPVRLLYPELPDGLVEVTPGTSMRSIDAVMWFSGETPWQRDSDSPSEGSLTEDELMESRASARLELSRERSESERKIASVSKLIEDMDGTYGAARVLAEHVVAGRERIRAINEMLPGYGGVVADGG